jgi:hypothetical protein
MLRIYFLIFWIPAIASLLLLMSAWRTGVFARPGVLVAWYLLAFAFQVIGGLFSPVWTAGLVLQVLLAIYIVIRLKVM